MEDNSLHLLSKYFGTYFEFAFSLHFESEVLKGFSSFYKEILMTRKKYFIAFPIIPSYILSKFLWYKSCIEIDNKTVY